MKRIALINDLSGFGKCSLTAAIPVISVLGIQACPLPTAILTAQTGFDDYYCDDYTNRMDYFTEKWKQMGMTFEGIHSGYLASAKQIEKVAHFLQNFKDKHTIYLADPVMGDHGETYDVFSEELLAGMKELTVRADVITPNLTELCLLADESYRELILYRCEDDYLDRIQGICQKLLAKAQTEQTIIVTGILRKKDGEEKIGNFAVSNQDTYYIETPYTGMGFSGTGDLFSSVICGTLVNGLTVREAMEKATDFLQIAIKEASEAKIPQVHGVHFEKYLSRLL